MCVVSLQSGTHLRNRMRFCAINANSPPCGATQTCQLREHTCDSRHGYHRLQKIFDQTRKMCWNIHNNAPALRTSTLKNFEEESGLEHFYEFHRSRHKTWRHVMETSKIHSVTATWSNKLTMNRIWAHQSCV